MQWTASEHRASYGPDVSWITRTHHGTRIQIPYLSRLFYIDSKRRDCLSNQRSSLFRPRSYSAFGSSERPWRNSDDNYHIGVMYAPYRARNKVIVGRDLRAVRSNIRLDVESGQNWSDCKENLLHVCHTFKSLSQLLFTDNMLGPVLSRAYPTWTRKFEILRIKIRFSTDRLPKPNA